MGIYANFGDDLKGSATTEPYVEWMELTSFSHGLDRPYAPGGRWDPANIHDFVFAKLLDKSSPKVIQAILSGTCFDKVEIQFTTTVGGEGEKPIYTITLEKVRITSYSLGGQSQGESMDTMSICAEKANWSYSVQEEEKDSGKVEYAYNIKGRAAG